MPSDLSTAEREYLRAKARVKLERQMAREAKRAENPPNGKVAVALLVLGLLLLVIGVSIVMHNNPWRTSPGPMMPVTTTPTTLSPRGGPGECGYPHSDECGYGPTTTPTTPTCEWFPHRDGCWKPDGPCVVGEPCVIVPPPVTTTTTPPGDPCPETGQKPGAPWGVCNGGPCPDRPDWCVSTSPATPPTTSPFPTELLCDAIRPRPPKCPPTTTLTITPGVTV
jgi:hypothetical protein